MALRCRALQAVGTRAEEKVRGAILLLKARAVPQGAVLGWVVRAARVADLSHLLAAWYAVALHADNTAFIREAVFWPRAGIWQPEGPGATNHGERAEHCQGQLGRHDQDR